MNPRILRECSFPCLFPLLRYVKLTFSDLLSDPSFSLVDKFGCTYTIEDEMTGIGVDIFWLLIRTFFVFCKVAHTRQLRSEEASSSK